VTRYNVDVDGPWSIGKTLAHSAQNIECSVRGYPFLRKGSMSHDVTAPVPGVAEPSNDLSLQDGVARLRAAIRDFEAHEGEYAPHLAFGPLSKGQYEQFHATHLADHLKSVRAQRRVEGRHPSRRPGAPRSAHPSGRCGAAPAAASAALLRRARATTTTRATRESPGPGRFVPAHVAAAPMASLKVGLENVARPRALALGLQNALDPPGDSATEVGDLIAARVGSAWNERGLAWSSATSRTYAPSRARQ